MKAVYTICSPSHIAEAKTLIASTVQHNPGVNCYIFLFNADEFAENELNSFNMAQTLVADHLGLAHFNEMKARYNAFELSCALKPYLADYLLFKKGYKQVVYFDADIWVTDSLVHVWNDLQQKDLILTGHVNSTTIWNNDEIAVKARRCIERNMLRGGTFNGGFFAMNNSAAVTQFLTWWKHVLIDGAYNKPSKGLFTDQLWLMMTPVLFNDLYAGSKHPGYNMAYWNLDERKLHQENGQYQVSTATGTTAPLIFYHFSGYRLQQPLSLSLYHVGLYNFASRPEMKPLYEAYHQQVLLHGHNEYKARYKPAAKKWKKILFWKK